MKQSLGPGYEAVLGTLHGPSMAPVWGLHGSGLAQAQAGSGSLVQGHLTLYENKKSLGIFIFVQGQIQNPWPWSLQEA